MFLKAVPVAWERSRSVSGLPVRVLILHLIVDMFRDFVGITFILLDHKLLSLCPSVLFSQARVYLCPVDTGRSASEHKHIGQYTHHSNTRLSTIVSLHSFVNFAVASMTVALLNCHACSDFTGFYQRNKIIQVCPTLVWCLIWPTVYNHCRSEKNRSEYGRNLVLFAF